MSIILFEAIQRDSRRRQRTNARYKSYLADLIVHLCFPLNKFSVFYLIQSKGGFAIRAHKDYQNKSNKTISISFTKSDVENFTVNLEL
jgi:hypothetical protein